MNRGAFVAAGIALVAACGGGGPKALTPSSPRAADATTARRGGVVVFRAPGFPTVDAPVHDVSALASAGAAEARSAGELAERLATAGTLVLPYGSAFPVDAWPRIRGFLKSGGSLVVLGGAPFRVPVRREGDAWTASPPSSAFAHDLLLGPAEPIAHPEDARVAIDPDGWFRGALSRPKTTWALTLRFATKKDFPDEHGSDGPAEMRARPIAHVVDEKGIPRGCPLLELDHESGARWIFASSDAPIDADTIRAIVARAADRKPDPAVSVARAAGLDAPEIRVRGEGSVSVEVLDAEGASVHAFAPIEVRPDRDAILRVPKPLRPGLHRVVASQDGRPNARSGFWIRDEALLRSGPKLEASRDFLKKDGATYPIVGTTYMASDAQRRFLFEPNPDAWDRDFATMKRHGITFVRTGLWTAWSRVIPDGKTVDPAVLDALEAYVSTAARHGIVVCFNLFAFLPPAFGGTHAYLDPRALAGQRAMLAELAARFRGVPWIHWDLINEPSYSPPDKLWKTRPVRDEHEKRAWIAWVETRHGRDHAKLRALWNVPEDDLLAVPRDEDLVQAFVQVDRRPRKARDFVEFTQDVVTQWAREMRAVLEKAGGGATLVTLGQDEGGIFERPAQQLMADALDYTAVHTWWNNDDLLWDGVLTKVADKPSLHQETGLMRLETPDGMPWRTPESAALLLERKLAYAFMARGAGVVEWAWNVNPTMPIDMESTIGLFRPDGTAKPELDALSEIAAFARAAAPRLADFDPDPVVLVIPHARAFLGRTNAIDATKAVVRTLAEMYGVVPTAVSDLRLAPARLHGAKLVLVPAPEVLDEPAAHALFEARGGGAKVLVTGPVEGDSYGREAPSLRALGLLGPSRPVARHERSAFGDGGWVTFDRMLQESVRRADRESDGRFSGNVWHEPLPLELAREHGALAKLLGSALDAARIPVMRGEWGVPARVLSTPQVALAVVVNERPAPTSRRVTVDGAAFDVPVRALGARLVLFGRPRGDVLAATAGDPIVRR